MELFLALPRARAQFCYMPHHNVSPICWLHSAPSCLPKFTPFSPHPDWGSENVNAIQLPTSSKFSLTFRGYDPTFSRQFPGPARIFTPVSGPLDSHTQNIADNADTRFRHKHDPDRHEGRLGMIPLTRSNRRNEAVSPEGTTSHAASESSIRAKLDSLCRKRSLAPRSNHDLIHRNMAMSPLTSQGKHPLHAVLRHRKAAGRRKSESTAALFPFLPARSREETIEGDTLLRAFAFA